MGKYQGSNQEPSTPQVVVLPIELYLPFNYIYFIEIITKIIVFNMRSILQLSYINLYLINLIYY